MIKMQKMDKTLAKKKNCKQKKTSLCVVASAHCTLHFYRRVKVVCFTSHFLGGLGSVRQIRLLPPASSFSALPSSPADPLRPSSHRRRVPMVATKRKPRRFPSMSLFREYAEYAESTRAVTARTKFQTLKNYKQTFDRCSWGWCFFFLPRRQTRH